MTLMQVLNARGAIKSLSEKKFKDFKKARDIARLRKRVESEFEFYVAEEQKAINAYAARDAKDQPIISQGGRVQLKDAQAAKEFNEVVADLRGVEIHDMPVVSLGEQDFRTADDLITPDEMFALEGLVIFE